MPRFLPGWTEPERPPGTTGSLEKQKPARPGRPGSFGGLGTVGDPSKTYSNILKDRYRSFKKDYAPFEQRILDRAQTDTSLIDQAREQGTALKALSAGVTKRGLERYGANPAAGGLREQQLQRSSALGGARAGVQALSDARINQYESNQSTIGRLVNIGQGISQSSLKGLGAASGLQGQRQNAYSSARAGHYANQSNILGGLGI